MSRNTFEILNEEPVTANAKPAEKMSRIVNTNPGQTGTAEDLGGPLTKPSPDTEPTPGKAVSAKAKKLSNRITQGAGAADPMPHLQGSAPGQSGVKEDEDMEDEDLLYEKACEEDEDEDGPKEKKSKKASDKMKEEFDVDVKEDVEALLNGEDLSEDFKFKAATIFEAAVKSKVIDELEKFEQIYEMKLQEEVEEIKESLETRIEAHLDYVSEQWLVENQLTIDNGLRGELAEEFILGIKNVFESCYVDIPEDKYDILGDMAERLDQMEEKLNEQIEVNVGLHQTIGEFVKDGIIVEVSEGLAHTQKEKLASLSEGVEFISEESYREKIETIKESYFPKSQASYAEDLVEHTQTSNAEGPMAAYTAAISKWSK